MRLSMVGGLFCEFLFSSRDRTMKFMKTTSCPFSILNASFCVQIPLLLRLSGLEVSCVAGAKGAFCVVVSYRHFN